MTATTYARQKYYHESRASILKDHVKSVDWAEVLYKGACAVGTVLYAGLAVLYFAMGGWFGFMFGLMFLMFSGMFAAFAFT